MPAQLPPRRTEPMVMENSHSSLSSTSTLKDISLREQPQPAKGISDGTKLSSPLRESRENSCAMEPQHHPVSSATTVPTTRIQMKTTRPLLVEEVRCDIRMDGRDSSYRVPSPQHSAINNGWFFKCICAYMQMEKHVMVYFVNVSKFRHARSLQSSNQSKPNLER